MSSGGAALALCLAALAPAYGASSHDTAGAGLGPAKRREVRFSVGDFRLTDQRGGIFQLSALGDKIVVVAFGYTTCPDLCPLTTAAMRQVQAALTAAERGSVYFLTVTTDPEVDKPPVLAAYAQRYGADFSNWSFVSGKEAELRKVWQSFGVKVTRKKRGLVDHTSLTALLDGGTARIAYYAGSPDAKVMVQDIRALLARR